MTKEIHSDLNGQTSSAIRYYFDGQTVRPNGVIACARNILLLKRSLIAFAAMAAWFQMGVLAADSPPAAATIGSIQPHVFRTILTVEATDARLTEQAATPVSR